jgi:hypothetical protein
MNPRARSVVGIGLLLSCALSGGCGEGLPSPAVIEKLRLLALPADRPEVHPGQGTNVRALWVDGREPGLREIHFLWRLCREGADREPRSCLDPARGIEIRAGTASQGADSVDLSGELLRNEPLSIEETFTTYFVLLVMCPQDPPQYHSGLRQYICPSEQEVANEHREGIQAIRRLTVRSAGEPLNQNPVIARVQIDGVDLPPQTETVGVSPCPMDSQGADGCEGVRFTVFPTPESVETRPDGMLEPLFVSFFVTAGSTDRPRAVVSEEDPTGQAGSLTGLWYPPTMSGPVRVWLVLRDGRGGDSYRTFIADVRQQ